jgi:hypothetical protein
MADYKMPYKGRMTIRVAKLESAFLRALNSVDAVIARRDEATKSGRFTADGVASDVLNFALSEAVPVLKRGRNAIASAKQEVAALREKTTLREPDTTDPWKVGLMLQAVDHFAAMTQKQRDALTRNPDNLDPITAVALVTAPASLTGISKTHREQLIDRALQAQHGDKIAELRELEQAIEAAESAVEAGRDEIRLEAGVFDPHKFNQLAAPVEQKVSAPWLRKRFGQVHVVDLERREERPATSAEIESGVYAENYDAYQKLTGRAA